MHRRVAAKASIAVLVSTFNMVGASRIVTEGVVGVPQGLGDNLRVRCLRKKHMVRGKPEALVVL